MPVASVNGIRLYYEATGAGAPLVLVHGFACGVQSWDPQVRAKTHRFMADCIPGASHVMIRHVGHLTNLEAPAAFNAAVKRFRAR